MLKPDRNSDGTINEEAFPEVVTLRFRDAGERSLFFGGLLDGWGENYTDLIWADGVPCDAADAIAVYYVYPYAVQG